MRAKGAWTNSLALAMLMGPPCLGLWSLEIVFPMLIPDRPSAQGFVKGYALVEYGEKKEAQAAIDTLNGTQLLEKTISVDWAFKKGAAKKR